MQSAPLAHPAEYCYFPRLSSRYENLRLDLGSPLPALALARCFQGDIAGHAYVAMGEDVQRADPEAGSSEALYSDCIGRKAV